MRCWVYVDGFNLYNGLLSRRDTDCSGCKWLDLLALARALRPLDTIECIKYFTAPVERRTTDPQQPIRQRVYWRALATIPCLSRIEGKFARRPRWLPLAESVDTLECLERNGHDVTNVQPFKRLVYRSEEKGSDVNLAAHLVHDANQGGPHTFEAAIVMSCDSDLREAVRLVTKIIGKDVYVYKPDPHSGTSELQRFASQVRAIPPAALAASQFPPTLTDARGPFNKPATW